MCHLLHIISDIRKTSVDTLKKINYGAQQATVKVTTFTSFKMIGSSFINLYQNGTYVDKCESNRDIRRSRDTTRGGGGEDLNENRVKESLSFNL